MNDDPPDPYARDLAVLRAAAATPESRAADAIKASRLAALVAEYNEMQRHFAAHPTPQLRTAELEQFIPPDPYAAGIKALQQAAKERR